MVPLARLAWECLAADGWQAMEVLEDETQGLLFDGEIALRCDAPPAPAAQAGRDEHLPGGGEDCWLRARLLEGSYDVPPVVVGLSGGIVPAVQRETDACCLRLKAEDGYIWEDSLLSAAGEFEVYRPDGEGFWRREEGAARTAGPGGARFRLPGGGEGEVLLLTWRPEFSGSRHLAVGDGFPFQSYELPRKGQLAGSFHLLAGEAGRPGSWSLWERVEDFDASGPEDRHYVLDEEEGTVRFGDCIHGLAPEGDILIAGQAVTLGAEGNIRAGGLTELHPRDLALCGVEPGQVRVHNPAAASGGRARESEEACFARARRQLRRTDRAVTYEDYERLVRQTPGLMISNCKAVPVTRLPRQDGSLAEDCVTVVVEPFSLEGERTLSPAYAENILAYLEERRMLGTKVALLSPEYVEITIYAEILSQPHYVDARERVEAAVAAFFRSGWEFGRPVRYSELYGIIDTLDCVQGVESLTVDAQGRGITRGINGDVLLPYNALAVLRGAGCQVRPGE